MNSGWQTRFDVVANEADDRTPLVVGEPATSFVEGQSYVARCLRDGYLRYSLFTYTPGQPVPGQATAADLAQFAYTELRLPLPNPKYTPPAGRPWTIGIPGWFWIDPGDWQPQTATASVPGLALTLTATPTSSTWNPGDGAGPITCGQGTPYSRPNDNVAPPSPTCGHTYNWRPHTNPVTNTPNATSYTLTTTITWNLTWAATNGETGSLGTINRTTTNQVQVRQIQAVGTNG